MGAGKRTYTSGISPVALVAIDSFADYGGVDISILFLLVWHFW